jgi:hypothetical protein
MDGFGDLHPVGALVARSLAVMEVPIPTSRIEA